MKKEDIELIIIMITVNNKEAVNMKVYKEGMLTRRGVGFLPEIGISGMSQLSSTRYFKPIVDFLPDDALEQPIMYEEETPNGAVEFVVGFYGDSKNGEIGEQAEWGKASGIRLLLDSESKFDEPILGYINTFAEHAITITNGWYFDVMILAEWNARSSDLPDETMIAVPNTAAEVKEHFWYYIEQMLNHSEQWDMNDYTKGKVYLKDDILNTLHLGITEKKFNVQFKPVDASDESPTTTNNEAKKRKKKKPWWKF